jgi:hypothetical protein
MHKPSIFGWVVCLSLAAFGCSDTSLTGASASVSSPSVVNGGSASAAAQGGRAATTGVVFVTSQGLYYDTFVAQDPLPPNGKFQLLANGATELGPGDPGYLGGRWWEDLNGNGLQDEGDHFFLCPLLPPGRPTP